MLGQETVVCPSCGKPLLKGKVKNVFIWWCECPDWELFCPEMLPAHHPKSFARGGKGVELDTTREMSDKQIRQSQSDLDKISMSRPMTNIEEEDIPTLVKQKPPSDFTLHAGITDIEGLFLQINGDGKELPKFFAENNEIDTAHPFSDDPKTHRKKKKP